MKHVFTNLFFLCVLINTFAQAPQGVPYQTIISNSSGGILANQNVSIRFSIHDSISAGVIVYQETHSAVTTNQGLVTLNIGQGTSSAGTFSGINWGKNDKFLQVEMDVTGGTNYSNLGTQQMMSVPYALHSGNGLPTGNAGDIVYHDGTNWVKLQPGLAGQFLQLNSSNIPRWFGATFPVITTTPISFTNINTPNPISSTAFSGVTIVNDGSTSPAGSAITQVGVCWSTTPNPTILDHTQYLSYNSSMSSFVNTLTGLSPGTTYYVRSFAIGSIGTTYGNELNFTTSVFTLATLSTTTASSITGGTAISGGNITDNGGTPVTVRGICWSTSPNPTIADNITIDGSGNGTFTSNLKWLTLNTTYYIRAYATNSSGTGYGNEISFTTTSTIAVGVGYQGGIVAYILQAGDPGYIAGQTHGLIAAPNDQSVGIQWSNGSMTVTGATAQLIGTGSTNTNIIVVNQGIGNYAAQLCQDLLLGDYSDWYLPSKLELNALYLNREMIGNLAANKFYWSSSEYNVSSSFVMQFTSGLVGYSGKSSSYYVRAIRSF